MNNNNNPDPPRTDHFINKISFLILNLHVATINGTHSVGNSPSKLEQFSVLVFTQNAGILLFIRMVVNNGLGHVNKALPHINFREGTR